jgi:hypothetical protein
METHRRQHAQQLIALHSTAAASCHGSAAVLFGGFELASPAPRPRAGSMMSRGQIAMKSVQPDNPNRIPLRNAPPGMGTIMIRFVGLLAVAVVVLALIWSR